MSRTFALYGVDGSQWNYAQLRPYLCKCVLRLNAQFWLVATIRCVENVYIVQIYYVHKCMHWNWLCVGAQVCGPARYLRPETAYMLRMREFLIGLGRQARSQNIMCRHLYAVNLWAHNMEWYLCDSGRNARDMLTRTYSLHTYITYVCICFIICILTM